LALAVDSDDALLLRQRALERGVILGVFRNGQAPIRITPPLNITKKEMDQALKALKECLQ
jgi:4-aminobutyrate aminotransferase-like enzyme